MSLEMYGSEDLYITADEPIYTPSVDKEITLDELEEEHAYLMRQYEAFQEAGKPAKAQELLEKAQEIADLIEDLEFGE